MTYPVLKGAAYCLVHAPDMLLQYGTTPATARHDRPGSAYLRKLPGYLRSYENAVNYAPNQAYLGRVALKDLAAMPRPWYEHLLMKQERFGPYGEMMPESEFIALMKVIDTDDRLWLEEGFAREMAYRLADHPMFSGVRLGEGRSLTELGRAAEVGALPLFNVGSVAGIVRQSDDADARTVLERLAGQAAAVLALKHLLGRDGLKANEVDCVITCAEAGDSDPQAEMARAIAAQCGCVNATASVRTGAVRALVDAAELVQSGACRHAVVVAGGTPGGLGLHSPDHVAGDMPVVEDVIGAFAIHIAEDDFRSPHIRLDVCGRHPLGNDSPLPTALAALVVEPLARAGLTLSEIDKFAVAMANPEGTADAGAAEWIGALAAERGEVSQSARDQFAAEHGFVGFAPTQGQIASGVPAIGPLREMIMYGLAKRALIIGSHPCDGVSVLLEKNPGRL